MATEKSFNDPPPSYPEASAPLLPQQGYPAVMSTAQVPYPQQNYGQYQPVPVDKGAAGQPYGYQPAMAYQPTVMATPGQMQAGYAPYPAATSTSGYMPMGPGGQQPMIIGQPQPGYAVNGPHVVVVSAVSQMDPRLHRINDHLGLSIFTTICCNIFFGIIAIVFSVRVRDAKRSNNYEAATSAYRVVLAMNISGIVLSVIIMIVAVIINVTGVMAAKSYMYG